MLDLLPESSIFNNARFDNEIITPIFNQYQIFPFKEGKKSKTG
jgi:hypothetical protein